MWWLIVHEKDLSIISITDAMRIIFSVIIWIFCGTLAGSFLLSCSPFTVPDRSVSHKALPETFTLGESVASPEQQWWIVFSSPQLNILIEEALTENLSLNAQWARLERAQAMAQKAGSNLSPSVSGDASASYTKNHADGSGNGGSSEANSYSLGFFASYELDLWGRVRAGVNSADQAV